MGDIKPGDIVSDPTTGGASTVIAIHPHPPMQIVRFVFDDGASLEVGLEHLWSYRVSNRHKPFSKPSSQRDYAKSELNSNPAGANRFDSFRTGTTQELIDRFNRGESVRIPMSEPVAFTRHWRPRTSIPPYLIGLFLGDGHLDTASITTADDEIANLLTGLGYRKSAKPDSAAASYYALGRHRTTVREFFYSNNLLKCRSWEKFIPVPLKCAPVEERLELLRGLLDTDGTVDTRGRVYFCSTSRQLAEDVQWIARSLGAKARLRPVSKSYTHGGEKKLGRPAYVVRIVHSKLSSFFKLPRKQARCLDRWNGGAEVTRALVRVEQVGMKPAQCITVSSPYGLYIADDFVVTHNSAVALAWLLAGNAPYDMVRQPHVHGPHHGPPTGRITGLPVDISYINSPHYRALMLRESLIDLEDFFDRAVRMYEPMGAKAKDGNPKTIEWPTGAKFVAGYLSDERDVRKYLGPEYHRIVFEQAEQLASEETYLQLLGSMRSTVPGIHPQIMLTCNPGSGPGQGWIKRRFIDIRDKAGNLVRSGQPVRIRYRVNDQEVTRIRVYIQSRVYDNPHIRPEYIASLMQQPPHIRKAWLEGDWHSQAGMFFEEFKDRLYDGDPPDAPLHVLPRTDMKLKPWWNRWMAMDWGYTHPSVVQFACENANTHQVNVYRELVFNKKSPQEAGVLIAQAALEELAGLPEKVMVLAVSPDLFDEEEHSSAAQLKSGIDTVLGKDACFIMKYNDAEKQMPDEQAWLSMLRRKEDHRHNYRIVIIRANNKRIHGWNRLRDMFRLTPLHKEMVNFDPNHAKFLMETQGSVAYHNYIQQFDQTPEVLPKLLIAKECQATITSIKLMIFAKTAAKLNTGDAEKIDGDDGADCLRYLCMAWEPTKKRTPEREYVEQKMERLVEETGTLSGASIVLASDAYRHEYQQAQPKAKSFTPRRRGRGQMRPVSDFSLDGRR